MLNNPLPAMASDADSMGTVQLSIEHPTSFYVTRYAHGDWNGQPDPNLWGAVSGQKTVYDPCPAGWRVPAYDAQGDSPYAFVTRQTTTGTDNIGRIYTDGNGNDFLFPVGGLARQRNRHARLSWQLRLPVDGHWQNDEQ